ncbi:MAG: M48 family metalloprotease [Pyrinomonadaceae bacterium]
MPTPVSDAEFRREVHQKLEDWVIKLQIKNSLLEEKIRKLIEPVLNLYGRMDSYDIIILNNKTPFVRLDAGVVLILTTGLFSEAQNDDEILGYIAHEIGHEYFTDYTIFTKHLFELVKSNGRERALSQRFADVLAILELECDAFAAITLSYLGYDSLAFIEGIERTAKKYKTVSDNLHPPAEMRRKVVTGVLADIKQSSAQRRISPIFKDIKQIIARQP